VEELMFGLGLPELVLVLMISIVLILPASRVCSKAGYPAWLGVAVLIPGGSVLLLFFMAFVKWPIETQLEALRRSGPA